jgi:hypothetical protein
VIRFVDLRSHFGRHVSHADEVITDVNRRRVMARAHEDSFTIAWDYPGRTLLEVRILRSGEGPAESADDGLDEEQELVYQDVTGSFRDTCLAADRSYFYTVFARHPGGDWVRWEEYSLPCESRSAPGGWDRLAAKAHRNVISLGSLLLCLLLTLAALALLPALAYASGGGGEKDADKPAAQDAGVAAATSAAQADPSVAAVLDGTGATVDKATPWGGAGGQPAGYTLEYRWPAAAATAVDAEWPLLRSDATTPQPPYDSADYRIRASDVTGLQVDVLLDGPRVIQVMPVDGEMEYVLEEQTWAPFSWIPWFTARPWVVAPIFVALAIVFMLRAWLRSRAWNRRLPSMTRHDRQFIARVTVLLFLLVGFGWQFYEGWYAATGPSVDTGASAAAGSLASLPLLLIPPGLFVAGLILELSSAPRRGSWALLAVLCGAASAYFLASAMTGATTNLNLSYYVLLAVLALIAIPRAFSAGKMGWSRSAAPRYG